MRRTLLSMILTSVFLVASTMMFVGCEEDDKDALQLVQEADAIIAYQLNDSVQRQRATELYDRALNTAEMPTEEDSKRYVLSHANFGLAITRSFDLFELVSGFLSGTLGGQLDEGSEEIDVNQYLPAVEAVVDSSLVPLADFYKAVLDDPDFEMEIIENGFLVLGSNEAGCSYGIDFTGKIDEIGVNFALMTVQMMVSAFRVAFSYNETIQVMVNILMSGNLSKLDFDDLTGMLNAVTDTNPLLDPSFGVFNEDGVTLIPLVEASLREMFQAFNDGLVGLNNQEGDLIGLTYNRETLLTDLLSDWCLADENSEFTDILESSTAPDAILGFFIALTDGVLRGFDEPDYYYNVIPDVETLLGAIYYLDTSLLSLMDFGGISLRDAGLPALNIATLVHNPMNDIKYFVPLYPRRDTTYLEIKGTVGEDNQIVSEEEFVEISLPAGQLFYHTEVTDVAHKWPTTAQIDEANGVVNGVYIFMPDPEINGMIRESDCVEIDTTLECETAPAGNYSNGDFNKLIGFIGGLINTVTTLGK
jgi:hypothetical protein